MDAAEGRFLRSRTWRCGYASIVAAVAVAVVARDLDVQMQGLVVGRCCAVLAELAGQSMGEGYGRLTILYDTVSFQDRRTTGKAIRMLGSFVSASLDRA